MTLVNIDQEVQFVYPDPESGVWKSKTGTIKDLLQLYTAYQFIKIVDANEITWGSLEDYTKNFIKILYK